MQKNLFFSALALLHIPLYAQQFISLNLCSDRLLMEVARPEQISAMSLYSKNPLMMLDKVNYDKPTISPTILDILPYLNTTVLINENFYPLLASQLKQLGVRLFPMNNEPKTAEELFELILKLGQETDNIEKAKQLIEQLKSITFPAFFSHNGALLLAETGIVDSTQPHYQLLLSLLGLTSSPLTTQSTNISWENLLLHQPNVLIRLTDKKAYSIQAEQLQHPVLTRLFYQMPKATISMNYTYCFDQGIWLAAEQIFQQLKPFSKP